MGVDNRCMFTHEAIMGQSTSEILAETKSILADCHVAAGRLEDRIDALLAVYDAALKDPESKIPTPLMVMIESFRP